MNKLYLLLLTIIFIIIFSSNSSLFKKLFNSSFKDCLLTSFYQPNINYFLTISESNIFTVNNLLHTSFTNVALSFSLFDFFISPSTNVNGFPLNKTSLNFGKFD